MVRCVLQLNACARRWCGCWAPRGAHRRADLVGLVALVAQATALAASRREATLLAVLVQASTIQLMRGSLRMTLCIGSTQITSYQQNVESLFVQYEFRTRRLPNVLPRRCSATARLFFCSLMPITPAVFGLPYVIPRCTGRLRPPRRMRTRKTVYPGFVL